MRLWPATGKCIAATGKRFNTFHLNKNALVVDFVMCGIGDIVARIVLQNDAAPALTNLSLSRLRAPLPITGWARPSIFRRRDGQQRAANMSRKAVNNCAAAQQNR
jgi:hypothetical protein